MILCTALLFVTRVFGLSARRTATYLHERIETALSGPGENRLLELGESTFREHQTALRRTLDHPPLTMAAEFRGWNAEIADETYCFDRDERTGQAVGTTTSLHLRDHFKKLLNLPLGVPARELPEKCRAGSLSGCVFGYPIWLQIPLRLLILLPGPTRFISMNTDNVIPDTDSPLLLQLPDEILLKIGALWTQFFLRDVRFLRSHISFFAPKIAGLEEFVESGQKLSAKAAERYGLSPYGFEASYKLYVTAESVARDNATEEQAAFHKFRRESQRRVMCIALWAICIPVLAALFGFLVLLGLAYDNTVSFTVSLAPILAYCILGPIVLAIVVRTCVPFLAYFIVALVVPFLLLPALYADGIIHPSYHLVLIPWYLLAICLTLNVAVAGLALGCRRRIDCRVLVVCLLAVTECLLVIAWLVLIGLRQDGTITIPWTGCLGPLLAGVALAEMLVPIFVGRSNLRGFSLSLPPVAVLVAAILLYGLTRDGVICAFPGGHVVAFVPLFVLFLLATGGIVFIAGGLSFGRPPKQWAFGREAESTFQQMLSAEVRRWRDEGHVDGDPGPDARHGDGEE
ncbi:hypothetical protein PAPYR_4037 [Paratrimastix pyriformis]|uniref:Uncharacterized protein n=1 Tax=Paratrimastix pyriformis TaxID=342808 RepID=A0ABQ8UQH7_9EUKA|nr:hypothetical protein PAPYR_4037 [Paratrimastix pyriformis]